jgi:hypothetical protein
VMVNNSTNTTKQTISSYLKWLKHKKDWYCVLFRFLSSFSVCFTVMSLWQFRMVYSYVPLTVSYGLQLCPFHRFVWFTVLSLWQFRMIYS